MWVALHDGWTVRAVGGDVPAELEGVRVPATVPGCVHTRPARRRPDPDPYLDENEAAWPGSAGSTGATRPPFDWAGRRRTTSTSTSSRSGLDTVATVELNGAVVGAHRATCTAATAFDGRAPAARRATTRWR